VSHLPKDAQVLVWGQVLAGMKPPIPRSRAEEQPDDAAGLDPRLQGRTRQDLEDFHDHDGRGSRSRKRRLAPLLVNACYWAVGLDNQITAQANVDYVGEYKPLWFGYGKFRPGVKPADLELK